MFKFIWISKYYCVSMSICFSVFWKIFVNLFRKLLIFLCFVSLSFPTPWILSLCLLTRFTDVLTWLFFFLHICLIVFPSMKFVCLTLSTANAMCYVWLVHSFYHFFGPFSISISSLPWSSLFLNFSFKLLTIAPSSTIFFWYSGFCYQCCGWGWCLLRILISISPLHYLSFWFSQHISCLFIHVSGYSIYSLWSELINPVVFSSSLFSQCPD